MKLINKMIEDNVISYDGFGYIEIHRALDLCKDELKYAHSYEDYQVRNLCSMFNRLYEEVYNTKDIKLVRDDIDKSSDAIIYVDIDYVQLRMKDDVIKRIKSSDDYIIEYLSKLLDVDKDVIKITADDVFDVAEKKLNETL